MTQIAIQSRFKSTVVWAAIVAQIIVVLSLFGLLNKWGLMPAQIEQITGAVLQLLVLFGVLNNGTNPDGF